MVKNVKIYLWNNIERKVKLFYRRVSLVVINIFNTWVLLSIGKRICPQWRCHNFNEYVALNKVRMLRILAII